MSDRVVSLRLATEQNERRADEGIGDLNRMPGQLGPENKVGRVDISVEEFERSVLDCLDVLEHAEGDVITNFGIKTQDGFLPFSIATLYLLDQITMTTGFSDINGSVSEIDFPKLSAHLPKTGYEILRALGRLNGGTTVPELTAATDRLKSTVTSHARHLAACDAVDIEMWGRQNPSG